MRWPHICSLTYLLDISYFAKSACCQGERDHCTRISGSFYSLSGSRQSRLCLSGRSVKSYAIPDEQGSCEEPFNERWGQREKVLPLHLLYLDVGIITELSKEGPGLPLLQIQNLLGPCQTIYMLNFGKILIWHMPLLCLHTSCRTVAY